MKTALASVFLLSASVFAQSDPDRAANVDRICEVVTNVSLSFCHMGEMWWSMHRLDEKYSRPVLDEALLKLADLPHDATNWAGAPIRQSALYWLGEFGTTNEIPFMKSRARTETGQDLYIALFNLAAHLHDVDSILEEWTLLLHEDRPDDTEFRAHALRRIERIANDPGTAQEDRLKLNAFLISEFPVENHIATPVWTDRHLTNAVPSWTTNEARRIAAERIMAMPTEPHPYVTNYFVLVLEDFVAASGE